MRAANLQVAHGDSRKSGGRHGGVERRRPITTHLHDPADDVDAVRVERDAEKRVQKKQLADDVEQVQAFDDDVGDDEVIAAVTATDATEGAGQTALQAQRKTAPALLDIMAAQVSDTHVSNLKMYKHLIHFPHQCKELLLYQLRTMYSVIYAAV